MTERDSFILANWATMSVDQIADRTKTTPYSVKRRANYLGLSMEQNFDRRRKLAPKGKQFVPPPIARPLWFDDEPDIFKKLTSGR